MTHPTIEELRAFDLLEGLDDAALAEWAEAAVVGTAPAGEVLVEAYEPAVGLTLLLEGAVELFYMDGERGEPSGRNEAPTWIGAIPSLTSGFHRVRMVAETDVRLARIERDRFVELVRAHGSVFEVVMSRVRPVIGRVTAMEQRRERLAGLGTMAAGLAHELNNPASAARRAAADLGEALEVLEAAVAVFAEHGLGRDDVAGLVALERALAERAAAAPARSALETADAEDELSDALDALGVAEPWRVVEPLAAAGADGDWLERLAAHAGPATEAAVRWVAAALQARKLRDELAAATDRMSALVKAVKTYAYMDRGELVEVDLHEGLDTTVTVLGHKLKHTDIEVRREYAEDLPRITVHGSELNQVWTNLIHNAIMALGDHGTITLATRRDGDCVEVIVADDGPGIPPELQGRIFDPFFTTKDVGEGTGLGLDTARRIVVDRHRGSLTFESEPGRTVFTVRLPLTQPKGAPAR